MGDPKHKVEGCDAKCTAPKYIGDGNCDDENNNCGCKYDGGDCCGKNVKKAYCKECKCKDPNYKEDKNCKGACGLSQYKGDGNCDDENNNCGCEFDGGDCCAGSVKGGKVKTAYCKQYQCKDPKHKVEGCDAKCTAPKYIGDGNCDDENNNCGCKYDGGDCCGKNVKKATARSANARTRITRKIRTAKEHAVSRSTRATATATTRTTTVGAISMEATAVRVLSRAERSKQLTA